MSNRPDIESYRLVSPIEPLTVAADLRTRGYQVDLCDLGLYVDSRFNSFTNELIAFRPDAVVLVQSILTFATAQDWNGSPVFKIAKQNIPNVVTILSGGHATNYPGHAVRDGICDYSIRGEVDFAVGDLLCALNNAKEPSSIHGVSYHRGTEVEVSLDYPSVDLSKLPVPAYEVLTVEQRKGYETILEYGKIRFPEKSVRYRDIMTSRSCPLRCAYCSVAPLRGSKQKYRRKPLELVLDEIEIALDSGIEEIHFFDDLFAESEEQILKFTNELVKRNLRFPWFVAQGIPLWPLSETVIDAMCSTGMYRLICPLESGNDRVLKRIIGKKFSTIAHHHDVLNWARKSDLEIIGMYVVGMPGESREELFDTINFADSHSEIDYSVFSIATPMVGTRLMKQVISSGQLKDTGKINRIIKRTVALYRTEAFSEYELGIIRAFDWDRLNFATLERQTKYASMVGITLEQLTQLRRHAQDTFYSFFPDFEGPFSFKELYSEPNMYQALEPKIA
ncbi:MAG: hypothetical protein NPIRA01_06650 [Nitrospirales bacterium]|nr:MAG: hypothetical protein NPIRA01_06650 [Nitrospirales bacterium]